MSQYENLIGTTRIPRRERDELVYGHQRKSRHIFLTRNGHVSRVYSTCVGVNFLVFQTFWFPVYDKNGEALGTQQIVELMKREVLPKSLERNNSPINLVSAVGRDQWADVYKRLEGLFIFQEHLLFAWFQKQILV